MSEDMAFNSFIAQMKNKGKFPFSVIEKPKVLEIGCDTRGKHALLLQESGADVWTINTAPPKNQRLDPNKHIHGHLEDLPETYHHFFDALSMDNVEGDIKPEEWDNFVRQQAQALKPDGVFSCIIEQSIMQAPLEKMEAIYKSYFKEVALEPLMFTDPETGASEPYEGFAVLTAAAPKKELFAARVATPQTGQGKWQSGL